MNVPGYPFLYPRPSLVRPTTATLCADLARLAGMAAKETDQTSRRVESEMILGNAAKLWAL